MVFKPGKFWFVFLWVLILCSLWAGHDTFKNSYLSLSFRIRTLKMKVPVTSAIFVNSDGIGRSHSLNLRLNWSGSRYGRVTGTCKCSNEPSDSTQGVGNSRLVEDLLASWDWLWSTKLVNIIERASYKKLESLKMQGFWDVHYLALCCNIPKNSATSLHKL